jgi:hypothetical protein
MKNIRELYEALLDGKTLIHSSGHKTTLEESGLNNFREPEDWVIYTPKWEMKPAKWWISCSGCIHSGKVDFVSSDQKFGMKYHTKEAAEKAINQMRRANLLRYWVSTMQDLDEGTYFIYEEDGKYYKENDIYRSNIGIIYMTKETAEKISEALNNGELILSNTAT